MSCYAQRKLKENIKTQGKVVDSFLLIFYPFYILLLSQRIKYMKQMVQNVTVVLLKVSHFEQIYSTFLRGWHISETKFLKSFLTSKFCPKAIFFGRPIFAKMFFGGLKIGGQKCSCTIVRFPPCAPSVCCGATADADLADFFCVCLSLDSKYFFSQGFESWCRFRAYGLRGQTLS